MIAPFLSNWNAWEINSIKCTIIHKYLAKEKLWYGPSCQITKHEGRKKGDSEEKWSSANQPKSKAENVNRSSIRVFH